MAIWVFPIPPKPQSADPLVFPQGRGQAVEDVFAIGEQGIPRRQVPEGQGRGQRRPGDLGRRCGNRCRCRPDGLDRWFDDGIRILPGHRVERVADLSGHPLEAGPLDEVIDGPSCGCAVPQEVPSIPGEGAITPGP